jgi:hypothetical protein
MPSLFATRFGEVAAPNLLTWFGVTVTIQRAAVTTAGVSALWKQGETIVTDRGISTSIIDRVWQIAKDAYTISGSEVEPRAGDRIVSDDATEWEVLPASVPAAVIVSGDYQWSISTKRVKS